MATGCRAFITWVASNASGTGVGGVVVSTVVSTAESGDGTGSVVPESLLLQLVRAAVAINVGRRKCRNVTRKFMKLKISAD
jgi:hypothetical protein